MNRKTQENYLEAWEKKCGGSNVYVWSGIWEEPRKVFFKVCFDHFDEEHNDADIRRRMRFLGCVCELIEKTSDQPIQNNNGNWELEGKTEGYSRSEYFRVVITCNDPEWHVITFHPIGPPKKKKKRTREKVHALLP